MSLKKHCGTFYGSSKPPFDMRLPMDQAFSLKETQLHNHLEPLRAGRLYMHMHLQQFSQLKAAILK